MRKLLILVFFLLLTGCEKEDVITTELNAGYDIVTVNTSWEDSGCVITINDDIHNMVISNNDITISELGEYVVEYSYNYRETEYICIRIVKVVDDIAPTIALNPGLDTIVLGETWDDYSVTAIDNFDVDLIITSSGTVNTDVIGRYEIVYTVTDDSLNSVNITRIVNVIE